MLPFADSRRFQVIAIRFEANKDRWPLLEDLTGGEKDWVYGTDVARGPRPTLLNWQVRTGTRIIDPALLGEFRQRHGSQGRVVLAVSTVKSPSLTGVGERSGEDRRKFADIDFAFRLERSWLAEWLDVDTAARPPLVFRGEVVPMVLGAGLPPRSRAALAAFSSFPVVSADEVRATVRVLRAPELSAADISRAILYGTSHGLLVPASEPTVDAYWAAKGARDRRPLRLYESVALALIDKEEVWAHARVSASPDELAWPTPYALDADGLPAYGSRVLLRWWRAFAGLLRERGVRTV